MNRTGRLPILCTWWRNWSYTSLFQNISNRGTSEHAPVICKTETFVFLTEVSCFVVILCTVNDLLPLRRFWRVKVSAVVAEGQNQAAKVRLSQEEMWWINVADADLSDSITGWRAPRPLFLSMITTEKLRLTDKTIPELALYRSRKSDVVVSQQRCSHAPSEG